MALFLTEKEVLELLPMERALERVEASFRAQHEQGAVNRARERILLPHLSLHYMAAAIPEEGILGLKIYTVAQGAFRFVVLLFDAESGALLSLMEADQLGRIRTGAASGVATKYMARADASHVGLIGTGRQARTQLEAVARVRRLDGATAYGRDESRRREFCRQLNERLGIPVEPTESAEGAVRSGDIVIAATSSHQPVIRGDWIRTGTHLNIIGANMANRREVDGRTLERAGIIAVDSLEQSKKEAGDLIQGLAGRPGAWDGVVELHDIIAGAHPGRHNPDEITIFKSCGIALWDVAVAGFIYRQALEKGKGREFEIWGK